MRLPEQVEVIVYRKKTPQSLPEFLLCKRIPTRGGFWQPLTGGVESTDESRKHCALRELHEEIGVETPLSITEIPYTFEFYCPPAKKTLTEYVFAAEVSYTTLPQLSLEHESYRWVSLEKALELLKYDSNKEALKKAFQTI